MSLKRLVQLRAQLNRANTRHSLLNLWIAQSTTFFREETTESKRASRYAITLYWLDGRLADSFEAVVTAGLNEFLGNNQSGETTKEEVFVFMQHNSIVRLDVKVFITELANSNADGAKLYRWNFAHSGFIDKCKNVVACQSFQLTTELCVSVC